MNPKASSRKPICIPADVCLTFIVKNSSDADTEHLSQKMRPWWLPKLHALSTVELEGRALVSLFCLEPPSLSRGSIGFIISNPVGRDSGLEPHERDAGGKGSSHDKWPLGSDTWRLPFCKEGLCWYSPLGYHNLEAYCADRGWSNPKQHILPSR